jgi:predicted alpha/beta-fold hydrolase
MSPWLKCGHDEAQRKNSHHITSVTIREQRYFGCGTEQWAKKKWHNTRVFALGLSLGGAMALLHLLPRKKIN